MSSNGVRRHPVMGGFAGFFLGLGLALMLFVYGMVPMNWLTLVIVTVGGIVLGIALAYLTPVRHKTAPTTT